MSFLKNLWGERKETKDKLETLGISVLADGRLDDRTSAVLEFFKDLQKERAEAEKDSMDMLNFIEKYTHEINNMLMSFSVPFSRAGDHNVYAKAVHGWSVIYTRMCDLIDSCKYIINVAEEEIVDGKQLLKKKEEVIKKLFHFFNTFYLEHALFMYAICWKEKDVSPSYSLVINQPQQMMFGGGGGPPQVIDSASIQNRQIIKHRER